MTEMQTAHDDWRRFAVELPDAILAGCSVDLAVIIPVDDIGYLYVIEFDTGTIKIGQTRNPKRRLAEHRRNAAAFGVSISRYWFSAPHGDYLRTEAELIIDCAVFSRYSKREYFHEINWSEAVDDAFGLAGGSAS